MSDQRLYQIFSQFDGTTPAVEAPTMPWIPAGNSGGASPADQRERSLDIAGPIGLFSPAILGFASTNVLVRVWADDPELGDTYQVVGASPTVTRTAAVPIARGPLEATILEMAMTDQLSIVTEGRRRVWIEVISMDEAQHFKWLLRKYQIDNNCCDPLGGDAETREVALTVATPTMVLDPWTANTLYVVVTSDTPNGVLQLPPRADLPLNARIVVRRDAGVERFNLVADPADTINGSAEALRFSHETMAVTLESSSVAWEATAPAPDATGVVTLAGTTNVPVPTALRTFVSWTFGQDGVLTLPPVLQVAIDQEIEVTGVAAAATSLGGVVIPNAGETIDGVVNERVPLVRTGDVVIFRRAGLGWVSFSNAPPLSRNLEDIAADPALGASTGWRGLRAYRTVYAAPGNLTLPTAPRNGTEILVVQGNAQAVTLDAGATLILTAGTSGVTRVLAQNVPIRLTFFAIAATSYWIASN